MSKTMLITADADESRVAIVKDGRLENLEIETNSQEQVKGNIYKGIIQKVEPSLQAAFVDFGVEKQGFLPFAEVHPRLYPPGVGKDSKATIQEVLKPKQEILVQVIRDEIGNKGATLTTYLAMPGRYLVLMPESEKTGISRKLPDEERQRIKEILKRLEMPDGFGVIVRTAGLDCSEVDLERDLAYLTRLWNVIDKRYQGKRGSGLLFEDRSLAIRSIRDYFTEEMEEVWLDNLKAYQEVLDFVATLMPASKDAVRLYRDPVPMFIRYGVEDQIEEVFSRRVNLSSGGSIVIDATEALVAVDVNSGKVKGEGIEETAFLTNMEAAREIARQVIIRDLGGLLIVDFIDMRDRKRMRQVENELRDAFKHDKARRKFSRISEFGLLEMSRQRLKSTLRKSSFERCTRCDGTGQVRTPDSAGMYLLRRVREIVAKGRVEQVIAHAPPHVANFIVNRKRRDLHALEVQHETVVEVHSDPDIRPTQANIVVFERTGRGQLRQQTQTIDLVRSEVYRKSDDGKKQTVVLRAPSKDIDFDKVYQEIEQKHGKIEDQPRPPKPTPVAPTAVAPVVAPAAPPTRRKVSWWQRLLGVKHEEVPNPESVPVSAPAATSAASSSGEARGEGQRSGSSNRRRSGGSSRSGGGDRSRGGRGGSSRSRRSGQRGGGGGGEGGNASNASNAGNAERSGDGRRRRRRRRPEGAGSEGSAGAERSGAATAVDSTGDSEGGSSSESSGTRSGSSRRSSGRRRSRRSSRSSGEGRQQGEGRSPQSEGGSSGDGGSPAKSAERGAAKPPSKPAAKASDGGSAKSSDKPAAKSSETSAAKPSRPRPSAAKSEAKPATKKPASASGAGPVKKEGGAPAAAKKPASPPPPPVAKPKAKPKSSGAGQFVVDLRNSSGKD